jgi:hypothetical protein
MHQSKSHLLQTTMAKTKRVKRGDAGSATGPTALTGVVEDSFVEDGVDNSAQVGTNDGDARWAAGSGDTAGVEHDGDEGSATGLTVLTCVDEESFVEDGVDNSEQVGTDNGNAKRAAGRGNTAGKEDSDEVAVEQNASPSSPLCPILMPPAPTTCSQAPPLEIATMPTTQMPS